MTYNNAWQSHKLITHMHYHQLHIEALDGSGLQPIL